MQFYAFDNNYEMMTTFNGKWVGDLHIFESSKTKRDEWVAKDKQYRTALYESHAIVQDYKSIKQRTTRKIVTHHEDGTVSMYEDKKYGPMVSVEAETEEELEEKYREQLGPNRDRPQPKQSFESDTQQFYGFANIYEHMTTFNGELQGTLHVFATEEQREEWFKQDKQHHNKIGEGHSIVQSFKDRHADRRSVVGHHADGTLSKITFAGSKKFKVENADTIEELNERMGKRLGHRT